MLRDFFTELRTRNGPLYWFGWLQVALTVIALILYFLDPTLITGVNGWLKPMKFAISITVYTWTFAWILTYLPSVKTQNFISCGVIVCMFVEITLIYLQAARGVRSHFNVTTAFDGMIFSIMGLFILLNTFLILYTIILFFSNKVELEAPVLWAWRAGLIFFFLGGISGGVMSAILHHSMGVEDGGPGLPFLNWSTIGGDIRSAHFVTLHGLQAIPLAAVVLVKFSKENAKSLVLLFSIGYLALCAWLHWLAFSGIPVIAIH